MRRKTKGQWSMQDLQSIFEKQAKAWLEERLPLTDCFQDLFLAIRRYVEDNPRPGAPGTLVPIREAGPVPEGCTRLYFYRGAALLHITQNAAHADYCLDFHGDLRSPTADAPCLLLKPTH